MCAQEMSFFRENDISTLPFLLWHGKKVLLSKPTCFALPLAANQPASFRCWQA
jgi:hypothetical protein